MLNIILYYKYCTASQFETFILLGLKTAKKKEILNQVSKLISFTEFYKQLSGMKFEWLCPIYSLFHALVFAFGLFLLACVHVLI